MINNIERYAGFWSQVLSTVLVRLGVAHKGEAPSLRTGAGPDRRGGDGDEQEGQRRRIDLLHTFDASVGVYRAAVTLPGGGRKRVSAKTRKACQAKLVELQRQMEAGVPLASGDRLAPFLAWWLASLDAKAQSGHKSPNTVDNARWAVETWIVPALGTKRLRDLQPEDVEALLATMVANRAETAAPSTGSAPTSPRP